jgi:hypothetical protein
MILLPSTHARPHPAHTSQSNPIESSSAMRNYLFTQRFWLLTHRQPSNISTILLSHNSFPIIAGASSKQPLLMWSGFAAIKTTPYDQLSIPAFHILITCFSSISLLFAMNSLCLAAVFASIAILVQAHEHGGERNSFENVN